MLKKSVVVGIGVDPVDGFASEAELVRWVSSSLQASAKGSHVKVSLHEGDVGKEILPGAVHEVIVVLSLCDLAGGQDGLPTGIERDWIESKAAFAHKRNLQGSSWAYVIQLGQHFDSIPPKLIPAIAAARQEGFVYLVVTGLRAPVDTGQQPAQVGLNSIDTAFERLNALLDVSGSLEAEAIQRAAYQLRLEIAKATGSKERVAAAQASLEELNATSEA